MTLETWQIVLILFVEIVLAILIIFLGGWLKIRIRYQKHLSVYLRICGISIPLYREKSDKLKRCRHPEKLLKEVKKEHKKQIKMESMQDLPLQDKLRVLLDLLKKSYRKTKGRVRLKVKKMHIYVCAKDAASTALLYTGVLQLVVAICQIIDKKYAHIERKPGRMSVEPDYNGQKCHADIDVSYSIHTIQGIFTALHLISEFRKETDALKLTLNKN